MSDYKRLALLLDERKELKAKLVALALLRKGKQK